jgi:hypothetical protein
MSEANQCPSCAESRQAVIDAMSLYNEHTDKMLDLFVRVYESDMHFGWGFEDVHDAVVELLTRTGRLPQTVIEDGVEAPEGNFDE